jgi:hypothetical protein
MTVDWSIPPNGNTGVFYRITEDDDVMWHTAPEFQIIDNAYNKEPLKPVQLAGANYDLQPPSRDVTRPVGSWNQARLLVRGAHVEHWLNGVKVVDYQLWTDAWERRVRESKFSDCPRYARARRGYVGLQDHGDRVRFRNIKIRELTSKRLPTQSAINGSATGRPPCSADRSAARQTSIVFCASNTLIDVSRSASTHSTSSSISG